MSQDDIRIVLEVTRAGEPIAGRVTAPDGARREFSGWTALASAIEAAVRERSTDLGG